MSALRNILIAILTISFFTFIAFFGRLPIFRNTPIGALHRVIWIYIPNGFSAIDRLICGGRLGSRLSRTGNYLLYDKHPGILIFFLGLVGICYILFLPAAWPHLSLVHHILITILSPQPFLLTYLCARSNPQLQIDTSNHADRMLDYPLDYVLYHPGRKCRTCKFEKPARSKHCSICKTCVARSDHHCVWVNNCVGRGNYKYFLALLLSMGVVISYGAYLSWYVLQPMIVTARARWRGRVRVKIPGPQSRMDHMLDVVSRFLDTLNLAIMVGGGKLAGVGLLAVLTAPLPFGLLLYHVYLIWVGTTTNESGKWDDWKEDMDDGVVFLGDLRGDRPTYTSYYRLSQDGMGVVNVPVQWPAVSKQILVRTRDGEPPRGLADHVNGIIVPNSWRRCWKLREVENLYDLGFSDTLTEILRN
ncbi:palmitoyltransferase swf1 [Eremomyces bilateralis CBS 781.70]|uniref:Palmitoyltransferase n=1 Tax=Eremomyces bilateralis CBS 781.70 TaxID=1392243 RepID=A0A6G1G5C7_9PEZI|nr:palmitoyltransferase swf1 [Eremomyces bilateralis CBS 781.70]KAF1813263.1 palmitoyltransferase swf1 [Eremomyces bilateralis CBS 781.70]